MVSEFHIDRQFGHTIFLNVENGIFTGCVVDGKMENGIERLYLNKPIAFLKEDFEDKMKGCYCRVRSTEICDLKDKISYIEQRIIAIERCVRERGIDAELTDAEFKAIIEEQKNFKQAKEDLAMTIELVKTIHNIEFA